MCKPFIAAKKMDPYLIEYISGRSYIIEPRYSFLFDCSSPPMHPVQECAILFFCLFFLFFSLPSPSFSHAFLSSFFSISFFFFLFFYFSSALPHFYLSQPFVWRFSRPFCCRSHSSSYSFEFIDEFGLCPFRSVCLCLRKCPCVRLQEGSGGFYGDPLRSVSGLRAAGHERSIAPINYIQIDENVCHV